MILLHLGQRWKIISLYNMTDKEWILNNIRIAIQLAGDGGPSPFNDVEYDEMFTLLDTVENNIDIWVKKKL